MTVIAEDWPQLVPHAEEAPSRVVAILHHQVEIRCMCTCIERVHAARGCDVCNTDIDIIRRPVSFSPDMAHPGPLMPFAGGPLHGVLAIST